MSLTNNKYAIHNQENYGPTFGGGHDICIGDNAIKTAKAAMLIYPIATIVTVNYLVHNNHGLHLLELQVDLNSR